MLRGNEGLEMECSFCHVHFWPRCGGYWFLLLSPRGRVRFPGAEEMRVVLCSGCGRRARELLEVNGYGLEVSSEGSGTGAGHVCASGC
jgi:hypothetical protein